jgi:phage shock protein A
MSLVARIVNLFRGTLARWVRRREQRSPDVVYEAAIEERLRQYATLRQAAAGVLYMRGKLAKELERDTDELERVRRQLAIAVDRDDDPAALALIHRRDTLTAHLDRLGSDLADLTREADAAKENLVAFQDEIARLREERARMLARLANARARLRLQETLKGLAPDADIRALDEVREHIDRLVAETQVSRELGDGDLGARLGRIRQAEAETAARAQLEELKRARRYERLVPMILPERIAAR